MTLRDCHGLIVLQIVKVADILIFQHLNEQQALREYAERTMGSGIGKITDNKQGVLTPAQNVVELEGVGSRPR
jgi:hypothetical protein